MGARTTSRLTDRPGGDPESLEIALLESALERAGKICLPVQGRSMAPLLLPGDRIEVVPCRQDLLPGDVILLGTTPPVVHRYLYPDPAGGLIARGDGARSHDFPWSPELVIGRVVTRIRRGKVLRLDRGPRRIQGRLDSRPGNGMEGSDPVSSILFPIRIH